MRGSQRCGSGANRFPVVFSCAHLQSGDALGPCSGKGRWTAPLRYACEETFATFPQDAVGQARDVQVLFGTRAEAVGEFELASVDPERSEYLPGEALSA